MGTNDYATMNMFPVLMVNIMANMYLEELAYSESMQEASSLKEGPESLLD